MAGLSLRHDQTAAGILRDVASDFGVSVMALKGPSRERRLTVPRQLCMYRLQDELGLSAGEIGRIPGGRDHTTVLHGVQAHLARTARAVVTVSDVAAVESALEVAEPIRCNNPVEHGQGKGRCMITGRSPVVHRPTPERGIRGKAGPKALRVMAALAERPGAFMSLDALPGTNPKAAIRRLRNSFGDSVIESDQGRGYRITPQGLTVFNGLGPALFAPEAGAEPETPTPAFRPAKPRPLGPDGQPKLRAVEIEPGRIVHANWDKALVETWAARKARRARERASQGQCQGGAAHG